MVRLQPWQWGVLAFPIAAIGAFLLFCAAIQIHQWHLNWIWPIGGLLILGWRWLLVRWTRPMVKQVEAVVAELNLEAAPALASPTTTVAPGSVMDLAQQTEAQLQAVLMASQGDVPPWEDWNLFWQRCLSLISAIAQIYYPQTQNPLLNIYLPQAYTLLRGTVDDLDQWMQRLSPILNQVTIGQAYQGYEIYQKLEPSARRLWKAWNWAQWLLNPVAAVARTATQKTSDRATQELLGNLSQLLREAMLRNLAQQAVNLYGGLSHANGSMALPTGQSESSPPIDGSQPGAISTSKAQTQTLREIIATANPTESVAQQPVQILLVGRTGAGKSSLVNTLFIPATAQATTQTTTQATATAQVDSLPTTDRLQDYLWHTEVGKGLVLWDSPGYEQVKQADLRDRVLTHASQADLLLLVTPALDPALQMDLEFLQDLKRQGLDLPTIAVVTQVDRLRPLREWQPPYDWQTGDRPKEIAIREAVAYRQELLGTVCGAILPVVTHQATYPAWGIEALSAVILAKIEPAKQLRLARFLQDQDTRIAAAANIIDRYTVQMTTTQGLTAFLKSPVLQFLSTLTTGSPSLALLLMEKIPVEQVPLVIGKLQMAYELFTLLNTSALQPEEFNLLALWNLAIEAPRTPTYTPAKTAWAFGHTLVEYWTKSLPVSELPTRFQFYCQQSP